MDNIDYKEIYSKENIEKSLPHEHIYRCCNFIDFKELENHMATYENPIIIMSKFALRTFIAFSGDFKRNPYAYNAKLNKYNLYGNLIDVEIVDVERMNLNLHIARIVVLDRNNPVNEYLYHETEI